MLSKKEIADSLTVLVKDTKKAKLVGEETHKTMESGMFFYNEKGRKIKAEENAVAKVNVYNARRRCWIKGDRRGRLYRPENKSGVYGLNIKDKVTSQPMFKWRLVPVSTFDNYLEYLKTGQTSLLSVAERHWFNRS